MLLRYGRIAMGNRRRFTGVTSTVSFRRQFVPVNEARHITAGGQADLNRVISALYSIVFFQPLAESVGGNTNDGVHLRIEIRRASKCMDGNAVLLDVIGFAVEIFLADKRKQPNKVVRSPQYMRGENGIQFGTFRLKFASSYFQFTAPLGSPAP